MNRKDSYRTDSDRRASLPGQRDTLRLNSGHTAAVYCRRPPGGTHGDKRAAPLLVVHSVNATASAFEMEPVVIRQARHRPVIALDLPGFGLSDKPDSDYSPAVMRQAIEAAFEWTSRHVSSAPIDVMALSLGCEFATEAVLQSPARARTLTLISPTGMEGRRRDERYEDGATREIAWMRKLLRHSPVGRGLYWLLTTRPSISWFLARSWGTREFDPSLLMHGKQCAALPGAEHAPLDFVAGALFTRGVVERYRALPLPVWVAHGTQGAFTDFGACPERSGSVETGGLHAVHRTAFDSGAMPHFQLPDAFDDAYGRFLLKQRLTPSTPSEARVQRADAQETSMDPQGVEATARNG